MAIGPDLSSIRPVASIDVNATRIVTIADAKQDAISRLTQIALGQQVTGKVLSALDDGTFLVRINDATARMNLPANSKPGESLLLTLTSTNPRPTFLLAQNASAAVTASVSPTGRLIDQVLQAAQQRNVAPILEAQAPALNAPTTQGTQIATALREAITFSGLFYESHLRQWAAGTRTLPDLLREPQAQLGKLALVTSNQPTQPNQTNQAAQLIAGSEAINSPATQLMALQLDTLENQRMVWRGELWPGQLLDWEISQREPDSSHTEAERTTAEPSWHSVVRFELPTLGTVSASIKLVGQRVQMQLRTDNDAAVGTLRSNGTRLADALDAAGSTLELLTIQRDTLQP
ncbi:MAG: flagellar hook-length control protein FliK [Herbaspirillum sp.]